MQRKKNLFVKTKAAKINKIYRFVDIGFRDIFLIKKTC